MPLRMIPVTLAIKDGMSACVGKEHFQDNNYSIIHLVRMRLTVCKGQCASPWPTKNLNSDQKERLKCYTTITKKETQLKTSPAILVSLDVPLVSQCHQPNPMLCSPLSRHEVYFCLHLAEKWCSLRINELLKMIVKRCQNY